MKVLTHLMFDGNAEEAMNLYVSLIPGSKIISAEFYTEGESEGKVQQARFELAGREFICIDTPIKHDFDFTPSMSIFVDFESEAELRNCYEQLLVGGAELMPLDNYGFSPLFGWLTDRFGVSWQLNLPG
jgi:predicted 3-demethylubiquinone-9 3-methyltransferase (glyoxalase superfamily)